MKNATIVRSLNTTNTKVSYLKSRGLTVPYTTELTLNRNVFTTDFNPFSRPTLQDWDTVKSNVLANKENGKDEHGLKAKVIDFPIQHDTEFQTLLEDYTYPDITTIESYQTYDAPYAILFSHVGGVGVIQRNRKFQWGFSQLLEMFGFSVYELTGLEQNKMYDENLPILRLNIGGHFLLADIFKSVIRGSEMERYFMDKFLMRTNSEGKKIPHLHTRRRLLYGKNAYENLPLSVPIIVKDNAGDFFRVDVMFHDTVAINGVASLDDVGTNNNVPMHVKDLVSKEEKPFMFTKLSRNNHELFRTTRYTNLVDLLYDAEKFAEQIENKHNDKRRSHNARRWYLKRHLSDWGRQVVYASGDNVSYKITVNFSDLVGELYDAQGIKTAFDKYVGNPAFTIGSTVNKNMTYGLIEALGFDLEDKDQLQKLKRIIQRSSASGIKSYLEKPEVVKRLGVNNTFHLMRRVFGGRAFNSNPLVWHLSGVIIDMDLAGAYVTEMITQPFPIGKREEISFEFKKHSRDKNRLEVLGRGKGGRGAPMTLRTYINQIRPQAANRLEHLMVQLDRDIPNHLVQDFLITYIPPQTIHNIGENIETDTEDRDFLDDTDEARIYSNDGRLLVFTSAEIRTLLETAAPELRKFILDHGRIISGIWYDMAKYITPEEFKAKLLNGENPEREYWTSVTIGKAFAQFYKDERGKHAKGTSENALYKLFGNTGYGASASRFFNTGHTTAMNNVTGSVRMTLYHYSLSMNGLSDITDGTAHDANASLRVKYKKGLKADIDSRHIQLQRWDIEQEGQVLSYHPIEDDVERYEWVEGTSNVRALLKDGKEKIYCPGEDSEKHQFVQHINNVAKTRLLEAFPNTRKRNDKSQHETVNEMLNRHNLAGKGVYREWVTHGTAHYASLDENGKRKLKMRSHDTSEKQLLEFFFIDLVKDRKAVPIPSPYVTTRILKDGTWVNGYQTTYKHTDLLPGTTEYVTKTYQAFTYSKFLYRTHKQRVSLESEHKKGKDNYGLGNERYFLNSESNENYRPTVNLEELEKHFDNAIVLGYHSFRAYLEKELGRENLDLLDKEYFVKLEVEEKKAYNIERLSREVLRRNEEHTPTTRHSNSTH